MLRDRETPIRQLGRRRSRSRSRSRIFGLDVSEQSRLDRNSYTETEEEGVMGGQAHILSPFTQLFMDRIFPVLVSPRGKGVAASLLLLLMLVFTQWVVGKGIATIVTAMMGPISHMRVAMMTLPDMMMGSIIGRRSEVDEVELLSKLVKSDKFKELIENGIDERMFEATGKEVDKKFEKRLDMVIDEVENLRKMLLDTEIKRLALREEELKFDKNVDIREGANGPEVGQDIKHELELVEIKVDQLKLNFAEFTKETKVKNSECSEELEALKISVEEIIKGKKNVDDMDQKLGILQGEVVSMGDRIDTVAIQKDRLEISSQQFDDENVKQENMKEMIHNVMHSMLTDPMSELSNTVRTNQKLEVEKLNTTVQLLEVKLHENLATVEKYTAAVVDTKADLKDEVVELTKSLLVSWSQNLTDSSVSLPQVSSLLESQLSVFSSDRTGQVDWASQALGGSIVSTPLTTTHPTPAQVFTILGVPVWSVSSSPSLLLRPVAGPGQCWAYSGQAGQVVIRLGKVVRVTGVTIEHVRPSPDMSSAPRDIVVFDHVTDTPLVNITYSINESSSSVQTFPLPSPTKLALLRLHISNNWGHKEFTCFYRVRVHGELGEVEMNGMREKLELGSSK